MGRFNGALQLPAFQTRKPAVQEVIDGIMDHESYGKLRPMLMSAMRQTRARRRVSLGPFCTLLFENTRSVQFHVQEVLFWETSPKTLTSERIAGEVERYSALLTERHQLSVTLLIDDAPQTIGDRLMAEIASGDAVLSLRLGPFSAMAALVEPASPGEPVNYLCFPSFEGDAADRSTENWWTAQGTASLTLVTSVGKWETPLSRHTRLELANDLRAAITAPPRVPQPPSL